MKVYLDNCCYNRPYDDQTQLKIELETKAKLHIQRLIVEGKLILVCSYLSRFENDRNPYENRRTSISQFFSNAGTYIDTTKSRIVKEKATEIMKTGVKAKDAAHVACAIIGEADYFVTTDIRLLKYRSEEIKIVNPVDFIIESEV